MTDRPRRRRPPVAPPEPAPEPPESPADPPKLRTNRRGKHHDVYATSWGVAGVLVTAAWLAGAVLGDWLPIDIGLRPAVAAVAVAAVVTATWAPRNDSVEAVLLAGLGLVALPTATALGLDRLPDGNLFGLAAVAVGGFPTAPRLVRPLLVPGAALAVAAATGTPVVFAAGAAAVLTAAYTGTFALPLALTAVAVAPIAGARPAAYLLAAAAALAAADEDRGGAVAVLAVPGAIAAAAAIAAGPVSPARAAAAVTLAAVAYLATTHMPAGTQPSIVIAPAAVLAAWLLLIPSTWAWAGEARLGHYDLGAVAATVAAIVAIARPWPVPSKPELP